MLIIPKKEITIIIIDLVRGVRVAQLGEVGLGEFMAINLMVMGSNPG